MPDPAFNPGFRFSALDGIILLGGAAATIGVASLDRWTGVAIAFVVLHFFLFCNVLRMPRPLELMWAALFALLAILATAAIVTWPFALGISLLATVIITIVQVRRPSYHGIAWKTLNPRLPQWWRSRTVEERAIAPSSVLSGDVMCHKSHAQSITSISKVAGRSGVVGSIARDP